VPTDELIQSVQQLSSKELESLLRERQAQDKALRVLLRAAIAREREERRQRREQLAPQSASLTRSQTGVASA
jgi:Arc/MetJ family transcription regulator